MFTTAMFLETMEMCQRKVHENAKLKGFWDGDNHNLAEKLCLIHSEISEATECVRDEEMKTKWVDPTFSSLSTFPTRSDQYCKPEGLPIELADAVIRIMDLCGYLKIDLGQAILDKMEYNKTRVHKHGRSF